MTPGRRLFSGLIAGTLGAVIWAGSAAAAPPTAPGPHFLPIRGSAGTKGPGGGSNLTYHSGPVEVGTAVYISWWGPAWSGFTTGGYTSGTAQTYVSNFFSNVGGSTWIGTDTQYCEGAASGATSCGKNLTHVSNPTGQLKGTWNDTTAVPANDQIQDSDVAAAAVRLASHFGGPNANATYIVFTPTGDSEKGFAANGGQWCAWHSDTTSGSSIVNYAYVPYQPDAGSSCGVNFVNAKNNSYGNGYFDGFSVVAGHEYEEAQTDPHLNAWYDRRGSEDADKCAWNSLSNNITLGSNFYAVQPVWSNLISGCTLG